MNHLYSNFTLNGQRHLLYLCCIYLDNSFVYVGHSINKKTRLMEGGGFTWSTWVRGRDYKYISDYLELAEIIKNCSFYGC